MSDQLKGLLITVAGIIALCPDSLLIRLINADQWTLIFWRGLATGVGICVLCLCYYRRNTLKAFVRIGRPGILLSVVFTASTVFFVTALHLTTVANTLILAGTAPIFAALLSGCILDEPVRRHTWITIFVVIAAVGIIVSDSFVKGSIWGDLSALACAIMVAGTFTIARQSKTSDMTPAMALSGFVTAFVSLPLVTSLSLDGHSIKLMILLGMLVAVAMALLAIGPRFIPAPEVSMLMPLETVFGTYLVWAFLGETPGLNAILGGLIVIGALSYHSALALKHQ